MPHPFGFYTKIERLIIIVTFALIFESFLRAFEDIFLRASSSYVLVYFILKLSSTTSIPLDMIENLDNMNCFLLIFYPFYFPSRVRLFIACSYFRGMCAFG